MVIAQENSVLIPATFRNARATNEDESAYFANFYRKIGCHGNIPWAIKCVPNGEKLEQIGLVDPDIICLKYLFLREKWLASFTLVNSVFTGPKFTKFTHNVARPSPMNFRNQKGDIAIPFGMSGLRMNVNSPTYTLPILTLNLVAVTTSLEPSEKGVKFVIYDQIPTIWWNLVKICAVDPEITLLKCLFLKRKKKFTHAEHIARGGCVLRVLNKYVRPRNTRTRMYADSASCAAPWWVTLRMRSRNRQTDGRQAVTLRFSSDAASVIIINGNVSAYSNRLLYRAR